MESGATGNLEEPDLRVDIRSVLTPEYYAKEIAGIFRRSWLVIGHSYDLPQPGDYFTRHLPGLNAALLVVRGQDGRIRAFHNICRHRGSPLVGERRGRQKAFACDFHGWTYDTQGALMRVTDPENFRFDRTGLGLLPVHCEEWETYLFINLAPQPPVSLREWMGELYEGFAGYFERFAPTEPYRAEVRCNWNLAVNSFTENYHTLYLHRHTIPDYQGGDQNPLRHLPAIELMKRHARFSTPANPQHRQRRAEAIAFRYSAPVLPTFVQDSSALPPQVNYKRVSPWGFDVVELFPNFVFLPGNRWCVELWFWPLAHDRTMVEMTMCLEAPRTLAERVGQELPVTLAREVMCEDMSLLEAQQASLETGALSHFHLNQEEVLLAHHYRVGRAMIEELEHRSDGR